jgi:hypothetical protein
MELEFWKPYPIDTIPDEYKKAEHNRGPRVMLHIPATKYRAGKWTFGNWDHDKYAKRPRPYWSLEFFYSITDSRANQPDMWMPIPEENK